MANVVTVHVRVNNDTTAGLAAVRSSLLALRTAASIPIPIRVDADTSQIAAAMAQIQALRAAASNNVNVNVNTSGGAGGARSMLTTLLAIGPAAIAAASGVAVLAATVASAAAGIGVFGAAALGSFSKIKGALQAEQAATQAASTATGQAIGKNYGLITAKRALAAAVENSSRRIADAQRSLEDAEENLARVSRDSAERIAEAKRQVIRATENVVSAQRRLDDANRDAKRAQEDLNDARREAVQDLADLQDKVEGAALAEKRAVLEVREAQDQLARTMADRSSSQIQRQEARLALEEAVLGLKVQQKETARTKEEAEKAAKAGVEGSEKVINAKERLTTAEHSAADAAKSVRDAQEQVAEANRRVAEAQEDSADRIADAQERIADAARNVAEAQADSARQIADAQLAVEQAMNSSSGAASGAATAQDQLRAKLAELTPAQRETYDAFLRLKAAYREWSDSLSDDTMPVFTAGIEGLIALLPKLEPLVRGVAKQLLRLTNGFKQRIETGQYDELIAKFSKFSVKSLEKIVDFLGMLTDKMAKFFVSEQFDKLMDYGKEMLPKAASALNDLAEFVGKFVEAAGPMGGLSLDILKDMAEMLNAIPMDILKQLAPLIIGVAMAMWFLNLTPLGMILTAVLLLATLIYKNWPLIKEKTKELRDNIQEYWEAIKGKTAALKDYVVDKWNGVKAKFEDVKNKAREIKDSIKGHWNDFIAFATGLPGRFRKAISGMWSGVTGGLKSSVNGIIGVLNTAIYQINDKIIKNVNRLPGVSIGYIPYVPYLARGGIAGGLAVVGENGPELVNLPHGSMVRSNPDTRRILSEGGAGGGASGKPIHITLQLGGRNIGDLLIDPIRGAVRSRGGDVQAVLGT